MNEIDEVIKRLRARADEIDVRMLKTHDVDQIWQDLQRPNVGDGEIVTASRTVAAVALDVLTLREAADVLERANRADMLIGL